jgi:hypothetical protein
MVDVLEEGLKEKDSTNMKSIEKSWKPSWCIKMSLKKRKKLSEH